MNLRFADYGMDAVEGMFLSLMEILPFRSQQIGIPFSTCCSEAALKFETRLNQ